MNRRGTQRWITLFAAMLALLAGLAAAGAGAASQVLSGQQALQLAAQDAALALAVSVPSPVQLAANDTEEKKTVKRRKRRLISFNRLRRSLRQFDKRVLQPVFVKPVKNTLTTINSLAQTAGESAGRAGGWLVSQPVSLVDRRAGRQVRETLQPVLGRVGGAAGQYYVFTKTPVGRWNQQFKRADAAVKNAQNLARQAPQVLETLVREEVRRRVSEVRQRVEAGAQKRLDRLARNVAPRVDRFKRRVAELREKGRELQERARWVTDPAGKLELETQRKIAEYKERLYRRADKRIEREKAQIQARVKASVDKRIEPARRRYEELADKIRRGKQKVEEKTREGKEKVTELKEKLRRIFERLPGTPPTVPGRPTLGDDDSPKRDAEKAAVDKAVADAVRKAQEKRRQAALENERGKKAQQLAEEQEIRRREQERKNAEEARRKEAERLQAEEEAQRKASSCETYDPLDPACEPGGVPKAGGEQLAKAREKKKQFEDAAAQRLAGTGGGSGTSRTDMALAKAETRQRDTGGESGESVGAVRTRDEIAEEFGATRLPATRPSGRGEARKAPAPDGRTEVAETDKDTGDAGDKTALKPLPAPKPQAPQPSTTPVPAPQISQFAGKWNSRKRCAETGEGSDYGYTWTLVLTQSGTDVRGTLYFHNCPCGGRASYTLQGQASAASTVKLNGTRSSARGPLAEQTPASRVFDVTKNGTPSPNYAPGRTSPCGN